MPWTRRQVKYLLSKGSPLKPGQKQKMKSELHEDPAMGHAKKGSKVLSDVAKRRAADRENLGGHAFDFRKESARERTGRFGNQR